MLLDVRWALGDDQGREKYLAGHLPGAVFVDLETELAGSAVGRRGAAPAAVVTATASSGATLGDPRRATPSSPTTPPAGWPRPGRGGCCAGAGCPTSGCSTAVSTRGGAPAVRWRPGDVVPEPGRRDADRRRHAGARPSTRPRPCRRPAACCSTPGRASGTAARWSRSTRGPATCPARSARRRRTTSPPTGRSGRPPELADRFAALGAGAGDDGRGLLRLGRHGGARGRRAGRRGDRGRAVAGLLVAVVGRHSSSRPRRAPIQADHRPYCRRCPRTPPARRVLGSWPSLAGLRTWSSGTSTWPAALVDPRSGTDPALARSGWGWPSWLVRLAIRRSWWTPAPPVIAVVVFVLVLVVGEQVFDWQADQQSTARAPRRSGRAGRRRSARRAAGER